MWDFGSVIREIKGGRGMKRKAAKTILALALCGAMTAGALAGCGGNEKETVKKENRTPGSQTAPSRYRHMWMTLEIPFPRI